MKNILCYGDSNTFGYNPLDGSRFDEKTRWTGILQENLKDDYKIIEEGANNRTGFVNNPAGFLYSAHRHFPKTITKLKDVDILILSVGTNDLQFQYDIGFNAIEKGLEDLILVARDNSNRVILIPPVILNEDIFNGYFKILFDETSIGKSKKVGRIYSKLANIYGLDVFDINKFTTPSKLDGLHYDENSHKIIADKLTDFILERKESES